MVVTPDNSTLIVAESYGKKLTAFEIGASGALSNRRVWADLGEGIPDGICLDTETRFGTEMFPTNVVDVSAKGAKSRWRGDRNRVNENDGGDSGYTHPRSSSVSPQMPSSVAPLPITQTSNVWLCERLCKIGSTDLAGMLRTPRRGLVYLGWDSNLAANGILRRNPTGQFDRTDGSRDNDKNAE